jgi:hypothetical protein
MGVISDGLCYLYCMLKLVAHHGEANEIRGKCLEIADDSFKVERIIQAFVNVKESRNMAVTAEDS